MDRDFFQRRGICLLATLALGTIACGDEGGNGNGFASGTYPAPTTVDPTGEDTGGEDDSDGDGSSGSTGGSDPTGNATTTFDPSETDGETGSTEATVDAFRFTELVVRDPHFYSNLPIVGCTDITDGASASVNSVFAAAIAEDDPMAPDGLLDLNLMLLFEPLDQTDGVTSQATFSNGACMAPAGTACGPAAGSSEFSASYTNMPSGATCLAPDPNLLGGYSPQPISTPGPCMHAGPTQIKISTAVFSLDLAMVEIAAQYGGDPAGGLISGSVKGFISRQVAESTALPADLAALIGATNVAGLLAGHPSNCKAGVNDMDGDGWWMHADFKAERVTWTP